MLLFVPEHRAIYAAEVCVLSVERASIMAVAKLWHTYMFIFDLRNREVLDHVGYGDVEGALLIL